MGIFECALWNDLKSLHPELAHITFCVETGTCLGTSTKTLATIFKTVWTVEISPVLAGQAAEKLQRALNVRVFCNDSVEFLKENGKKIKEPCLFFLDAHYSGDLTTNWQNSVWKGYGVDTMSSSAHGQVPLLEEVEWIVNNFNFACCLYIDDMCQFDNNTGQGLKNTKFIGEDWSNINKTSIVNLIKSRNGQILFENDEQALFYLPARENDIFPRHSIETESGNTVSEINCSDNNHFNNEHISKLGVDSNFPKQFSSTGPLTKKENEKRASKKLQSVLTLFNHKKIQKEPNL